MQAMSYFYCFCLVSQIRNQMISLVRMRMDVVT